MEVTPVGSSRVTSTTDKKTIEIKLKTSTIGRGKQKLVHDIQKNTLAVYFANKIPRLGHNQSIDNSPDTVRKSNSRLGEAFTSNWKLNRKGCFRELANSLESTVDLSLQRLLFRLTTINSRETILQ